MNREQATFLIGGLAFGILLGAGVYHAVATRPDPALVPAEASEPPMPRGPAAPTQGAAPGAAPGAAAAPMIAEINRLKGVLQAEPTNAVALRRLGDLYHDAGMFQQAVGYYERLRELTPQDADLLTDLGVCYRGLGEFDRALGLFAEAHRAVPRHWQSLFNTVIVAASDAGRFDLAAQALDALEALDPPPPDLDRAELTRLREAFERLRAEPPPVANRP
jgi:tetratricopeptide (TPR) repeat protein